MKKAFFITLILLVITLVALFYVKFGFVDKINTESNTSLYAKNHTNEQTKTPESYLRITFMDVGQGDANLIEWSDGTQMVVDCAQDAQVLSALGRNMKYNDKTLDYLVVTHPDIDHYGGCIDVLKRFSVKNIIYTGLQKDDDGWKYLWDMIQQEGAQYIEIKTAQLLEIGETTLNFLYPDTDIATAHIEKDNNASLVFKLSYGESDALFVGDAEAELEKKLIENYGEELEAEVLKVGHHGSGGSSSQDFVDLVSPDISVISVGKENNYGHPSQRVVRRLERIGSQVWQTDKTGDIIVQVEKKDVFVK